MRIELSRQVGFTLIELLLVMALLALMAGMAVPRFTGWLAAAQLRAAEGGIKDWLEALPSRAFFLGQQLELADERLPETVPQGWYLRSEHPILYEANGMTAGGRVQVMAGDSVQAEFLVAPPAGAVTRLAEKP